MLSATQMMKLSEVLFSGIVSFTIGLSGFECIDDSDPTVTDDIVDTDHTMVLQFTECIILLLQNRRMLEVNKMSLR